jgi:hypothetical protein
LTDTRKVLWTQMEGLNALLFLAGATREPSYPPRIRQTLGFVAANMAADRAAGAGAGGGGGAGPASGGSELLWQVPAQGGPPLPFAGPAADGASLVRYSATDAGSAWKTPFHPVRALLRLAQAGY